MKISDYAPRAAGMDFHLKGTDLVGIEVGCDVGAHAEALLKYCSVKKLYLVDIWDKEFYRGYCHGRLASQGFKNNVVFLHMDSEAAALQMKDHHFDFVYIDIPHDYETVKKSLNQWWLLLNPGGVFGYRNYAPVHAGLVRAVDEFVEVGKIRTVVEKYHNEIVLFK